MKHTTVPRLASLSKPAIVVMLGCFQWYSPPIQADERVKPVQQNKRPRIVSVSELVRTVQGTFDDPSAQNLAPDKIDDGIVVATEITSEQTPVEEVDHRFPNPTPIDLATALQWAAGDNPQVAFAQFRQQEALAQLRSAEVLWVPSLRAGLNYNKHEGRIQDVSGRIIETSRGSLYNGLGAQAVGAGSPSVPGLLMNFHTRDAVFQPRIATQVLGATQEAARAITNNTLLDASLAYTALLEAVQILAVADETNQNAAQLAEITESYARTGQGLQADSDRGKTELSVRQVELRRAEEGVRVASVRLARILSQDPIQTFLPLEPQLVPIELVCTTDSLKDLVASGLGGRPELAESQFLVGEAVQRLRREKLAPLVPSVLLGLSYGGNGGGLGGDVINYGDRLDFDVAAYWEVRNFGLGERAARDQAKARLEQSRWQQVRVMDQIASEIAESHVQVSIRKEQIELARSGVEAAMHSYQRNSERIREGQGLPIETLQALQALDLTRRQYVRAIADHNRAQFQLQRALGWPVGSMAQSEVSDNATP